MAVMLTSLEPLVATLRDDGYRVVGPIVRDGAIVPAPAAHRAVDGATGWYRRNQLHSAGRGATAVRLPGVRGCDLPAIAIQDRVLGGPDSGYGGRRERVFVVAVNCTEPVGGASSGARSGSTSPRRRTRSRPNTPRATTRRADPWIPSMTCLPTSRSSPG
jgi:hypothetical protein